MVEDTYLSICLQAKVLGAEKKEPKTDSLQLKGRTDEAGGRESQNEELYGAAAAAAAALSDAAQEEERGVREALN